MLRNLFKRDRSIMPGLIVLGLMMAAAGLVAGRSTLDFVLAMDARTVSESWTRWLESQLSETGADGTAQGLGNAWLKGFGDLVDRANREEGAGGGPRPPNRQGIAPDAVARASDFALLSADRTLLFRSGGLAARSLGAILRSTAFDAAFETALATRSPQVMPALAGLPETEDGASGRLVLVPVEQAGRVHRVYIVKVDQSSATRLTGTALQAITLTMTLLIVMAFVVPAAIAARRIRERWSAEDEIHFLALHDALTGLPNRVQLQDRLGQAVARAKRHGNLMAVFCLDLDGFKNVNDTLGHAAGDALLKEVAARLEGTLRDVDVAGRLGGDEFAIVAEDFTSPDHAALLANRLCRVLAEPYHINGHHVVASASIGIAFGPLDAAEADVLLRNADVALYRAKHQGGNTFCFFEPKMDSAIQRQRRLRQDLSEAVLQNELDVHYQPQLELASGRVVGYEALLRWRHPMRGNVPPADFIPVAEESGLIAPIGECVLRRACAYAARWPEQAKLAVNLSPAQFRIQDVVALVTRVLEETGFPPRRLELEITESVLLTNTEAAMSQLRRLAALGVSLVMEDFGTGYSSLSYLTRLPVRKIKIDSSFIHALGSAPETSAIVKAIIGLGRSLDVAVAAEGVETPQQLDLLRAFGCDQAQGYLCGRPGPAIADQPVASLADQTRTGAAA